MCDADPHRFSDHLHIDSSIMITVHSGSMFYMSCIIAITVTNVIIDPAFPHGYTNIFDTLQLIIHSVLGSRIMFHLRIYETHTSLTSIIPEDIQYKQPLQIQTNESSWRRSNVSDSEV
ncbi:hypothetical protein BDR07DRAFT_192202 [Suillus spraguei]|nr:hypothetical protein BDR07DRAFT_192202 [Suillus spraguei]